jgi:hypothetical protein
MGAAFAEAAGRYGDLRVRFISCTRALVLKDFEPVFLIQICSIVLPVQSSPSHPPYPASGAQQIVMPLTPVPEPGNPLLW